MIKFIKIKIDKEKKIYRNIKYLEDIYYLIKKYDRFLNDDYSPKEDLVDEIINLVSKTNPFFWVILKDENFAGIVYLENIIGNQNHLHSAEITTVFKKEYWGSFTKKTAKKFITYCFKKLKFKKLKALVFKENSRAFSILKSIGMTLEAELKAETMKNGKLQDVEIYSIIRGKNYENNKK